MTKQANKPAAKNQPKSAEALHPLPSASQGNRALRLADAAALVIATIMLLVVIQISTRSVAWPQDAFSDLNTLLAGESFSQQGLINMRFLPVHYAGPDGLGPGRNYYTHYPPLSDVMNGVFRMMGITSLSGMRVAAAIFGIAGWLLLYRAIAMAISPLAGVLALAFVAGSGFFFSYAISVHQHSFNTFFLGLFFLFFLRAVHADKPRFWPWAVCWAALMLESLNSFEFILYPQVAAWVYVLVAGVFKKNWKKLPALASAPVAGVGLHFLQNVWALGWEGAWADKLGYGQYGGEARSEALAKLGETLSRNIELCFQWSWTVLAILTAAVIAAALLGRKSQGRWRTTVALLAATAVAPWGWYLGMPAHVHHPHTVNQLMPLAMAAFGGAGGLMIAGLAAAGATLLKPAAGKARGGVSSRESRGALAALGIGATWVLLGIGVFLAGDMAYRGSQAIDLRLTPDQPAMPIFQALGHVKAVPDRSAILFNMEGEAYYSYFLRNYATLCPMHGLPFPESLPALQRCLPEGWNYSSYIYLHLLDSTNHDPQAPLYDLLRGNCPGKMLEVQGRQLPLILFDISALLLPPGQRKPLDPAVRDAQMHEQYPPWSPPGLQEELQKVLSEKG